MKTKGDKQSALAAAARILAIEAERFDLFDELSTLGVDAPIESGSNREPRDLQALLSQVLDGPPSPIGIWLPQTTSSGLSFQRDLSAVTHPWWAPVDTLEPKQALLPLRICVLGESTAAGWFYAPHLTPSIALKAHLESATTSGLFEVIDLTMVNFQPDSIVDLAAHALQLSPDIVVLFAGNNWAARMPTFPNVSPGALYEAAGALGADGPLGLARMAQLNTARRATSVMLELARLSELAGVPTIVVVPEVNLADWHRDRPVAWLSGAKSDRWHQLHAKAIHNTNIENWSTVRTLASDLMSLDGGSCPSSFRLRAKARQMCGDRDGAMEDYRASVSARIWDNFPSVPSASVEVQTVLRHAREQGLSVVDLPEVFSQMDPQGIPGRRWFVDYCHLTPEGMHVAMAATAAEILKIAGPPSEHYWTYLKLLKTTPFPDLPANVESQARFMSALYNAHYGSELDPYSGACITTAQAIVGHWLDSAALEDSNHVDAALKYLQSRATPHHAFALSTAQQQLFEQSTELERHTSPSAGFDPEVLLYLATSRQSGGTDFEDELNLLYDRHSVGSVAQDLTRAPYHWSIAQQHQGGAGLGESEPAFFRARWSHSHFCMVAASPCDVQLAMTARLVCTAASYTGAVAIEVNGEPLGEVEAGCAWRKLFITVPANAVRRGFNRVTLIWPALAYDGDTALSRIQTDLRAGIPTDLHPVFGEVYALKASQLGAGA